MHGQLLPGNSRGAPVQGMLRFSLSQSCEQQNRAFLLPAILLHLSTLGEGRERCTINRENGYSTPVPTTLQSPCSAILIDWIPE